MPYYLDKDLQEQLTRDAIGMANEGLRNKQIAFELIISETKLIRLFKQAGYTRQTPGKALRLSMDQERISTVAEKVGVEVESLKQVLTEEGWIIRPINRRHGPRRHGPHK